ncbi:hypothetical protein Tco_0814786 [Tanacetum coccineum]
METKDTLSSCSYSDEQDMQQMLKQAKILKVSSLQSHIFGEDVDTFTRTFSQNMDTLEQQLTKETILESNCQNAFRVLKTQFEKFFSSVLIKPSSLDGMYARKDFHAYTSMEPQLFKETILKNFDFIEDYHCQNTPFMHNDSGKGWNDQKSCSFKNATVKEVKALDSISEAKKKEVAWHNVLNVDSIRKATLTKKNFKSIDERAHHKREYDSRVNEKQMQTIEEKVDTSKALDASLVDTETIGTESKEQDKAADHG